MNQLYRVVVNRVTEYVVSAPDQTLAELYVRESEIHPKGALEVTESTTSWSEPVRLVGEEYSA